MRIHLGLYANFIEDWLQRMQKEQLHIVKLERYSNYRMNLLSDIFNFLKLGIAYILKSHYFIYKQ